MGEFDFTLPPGTQNRGKRILREFRFKRFPYHREDKVFLAGTILFIAIWALAFHYKIVPGSLDVVSKHGF